MHLNNTHHLTAHDLGFIMGANPIAIVAPCHRVTRGQEMPDMFVGGLQRRDWLDSHEISIRDAALPYGTLHSAEPTRTPLRLGHRFASRYLEREAANIVEAALARPSAILGIREASVGIREASARHGRNYRVAFLTALFASPIFLVALPLSSSPHAVFFRSS